ncbi:MAG: hypothetical protein HQM14_21175 [SAR324 cluster bacterium]|nr:hypothetical protein [SAR324 cluster bacterium]
MNESIGETRREYWERHIVEWRNSGLSQAQYCRENHLNYQLFCKWKKRSKKRNLDSRITHSLIPVQIKPGIGSSVNLWIRDRYRLELRSDCDLQIVANLLQLLESR